MKKRELLELLAREGLVEEYDGGWYRMVTLEAIRKAANHLFRTRETITEADVKCRLVNRGYRDGHISYRGGMTRLVKNGEIKHQDVGTCRVYSKLMQIVEEQCSEDDSPINKIPQAIPTISVRPNW